MKRCLLYGLRSIVLGITFCLCVVTGALLDAPGLAAPTLAGCGVLPADNIWNTPVDTLPVAADSAAFIATIGPDTGLHPDFGAAILGTGPIGIPYNLVPESQPKVPITFAYADESDPGPYPIPPHALIEGGEDATGDRHVLVLDYDNCLLYEVFCAYPQPNGTWEAGSGAIFDLSSNALRPAGWTSADAAGLPILPGLVRYDETAAGEITHAIRFTAPRTRKEYVWPARHHASNLTEAQYPPMGQRFRLKADYDITGFSPQVQVILRALKKYGMILADNGSAWFLSGVPDARWDDDVLVNEMKRVKGSAFEAIDASSLMVDPDSGRAGQAPLVRADFSADKTSGIAPLTVNFQDLSTGSITSWDWRFGDGGAGDEQDPVHVYQVPGRYTVTLTVTGPEGTDTETRQAYIHVVERGWEAFYSLVLDEEGLLLLRAYRDVCLSESAPGRRYVDALYEQSGEVLRVLLDNPDLCIGAGRIFSAHRAAVREALAGRHAKVYNTSEILAWLEALARRSPPALSLLARRVMRDLAATQESGEAFFGFDLR